MNKGATKPRECLQGLRETLKLTDSQMEELIPSGQRTRAFDRADWAAFHLMHAGLVARVSRGTLVVTQAGKAIVEGPEDKLTKKRLAEYPDYRAWREANRQRKREPADDRTEEISAVSEPPEETIERAASEIEDALAENLLSAVLTLSPLRFERLILDLLKAMGYGGGRPEMYRETPRSGDNGFDGIIDEDALGLDAVYIQAKRYGPDNKVGREALQAFVGSLTGEGASKGVFVTTSDFSSHAQQYVSRVQQRIVLINGDRLARLMIRHDVGVRPRQTYVIRSVDEDYFTDTV